VIRRNRGSKPEAGCLTVHVSPILLEDIYVLDRYIIARTMDDFEKVSIPNLWARLKPCLYFHLINPT
jgi:hypothetical protein